MAALVGFSAPAFAQTNDPASETVQLAPVDVVDTQAPAPAYTGFDPVDTGVSVIGETGIAAHESGSGDAMDIVRLLPNVRFDIDQGEVDRDNYLDLRPSEISIAGGQPYDNLFRLDGVRISNVTDTSNDNPYNYNEIAGAGSQTVFLDPGLIGAIELRDSNVSARYGDFSGGVVDVQVRDPGEEFGVTLRAGYRSDDLVDYIYEDGIDVTGADAPPTFLRTRIQASVDIPVNERFGLLVSLARQEAEVDYNVSEGYGGGIRGMESSSDNVLVKGVYDFSDTLSLNSTLIWSPYESQASNQNGIDNLITTHGGGLTARTELAGETGETDWSIQLAYLDADMSREAPAANFSFDSDAPSIDYCTNTNCSSGGFGDLEQHQRDLQLEGDFTRPFLGGTLSGGAEWSFTEARRQRTEDAYAYSRGTYNANVVCADAANDPACIDGEIALPTRFVYAAYDAQAEIMQTSAWLEQERDFGPVTLRGGLRWTHDDFLDNHDVAGRLSAAWQIVEDWTLTGGLNRYYAGDFVGYALREAYPDLIRETRDPVVSGTDLIYSPDDWTLNRVTRLSSYRQADLETPYSDEATLALTFPAFTGVGRIKAVQRWHRDQIVRQPVISLDETADGDTFTRRVYFPSNEGNTDYLGLSAEWSGSWRNHALTLNVNWSDTTTRAEGYGDYFDELDTEELLTDLVIYEDEILALAEVNAISTRANFATPLTANASLVSSWFNDALTTTLWLSWRDEYETIADTGVNETRDGVRYDVYGEQVREAFLTTDLNILYTLPETEYGQVGLEARITNLFSELPYTDYSSSSPWQQGRSIWLGVNYTY